MRALPIYRASINLSLETPLTCPSCSVYGVCGGAETVPCHCVFSRDDSRYQKCDRCHLWCREGVHGDGRRFDDEVARLTPIHHVGCVNQEVVPRLPLFIPTRIEEFHKSVTLRVPWVGLDLRALLSRPAFSSARLTRLLRCSDLRKELRLSPDTALLAVLHGTDLRLEAFWGMNRHLLYDSLRRHRFDAVFAPTFSVYDDTAAIPASHNVLQLLRHSHVLAELSRLGIPAIPNIYVRSAVDRDLLIRWLQQRTEVHIVARDFSRTRGGSAIKRELATVLMVLNATGRSYTVLVTGIATKTCKYVIHQLAHNGHRCSIVSGRPIVAAIRGRTTEGVSSLLPRRELSMSNMRQMARRIRQSAGGLPLYQHTPPDNVWIRAA